MRPSSIAAAILTNLAGAALAQPSENLAGYFGFDEPRTIVLDEGCGPAAVGDFNADGRPDLAVANNRKSRIEVHYLRDAARTAEETQRALKANELAPSPWYDPVKVSVAHRVGALRVHDVDGDGKLDLVYAGSDPSELVVLRQADGTRFEVLAKTRVRELAATRRALEIANVQGDSTPELIALAENRIRVYPLGRSGRLGEPTTLGSGGELRLIRSADFNGDGRTDILGVVPDDASPLRLWPQALDPRTTGGEGFLSTELRFEMPQLQDAAVVQFPGKHDHPGQGPGMVVARDPGQGPGMVVARETGQSTGKVVARPASIGVIERASRREVFFDLSTKAVSEATGPNGEREVQAAVTAFPDTTSKNRSVALADFDGDGRTDLLTTDQKANALVLFRQQAGVGLTSGEPFSAFKQPKMIDVGRWTGDPGLKVFVLSEQEKAVGMCKVEEAGRVSFPSPIALATPGSTPLVLAYFEQGGTPMAGTGIAPTGEARGTPGAPVLAVLAKAQRDYTIELHQDPGGDGLKEGELHEATTSPVKDLKRDPSTLLPLDADRDGVKDLLLMTPNEAMVMIRCEMKEGKIVPAQVLGKDQMLQFGLVQAAGPENTARFDADGDGHEELLIADANFVRACSFDLKAGWRVVEQVNVPDSAAELAGLALLKRGEAPNSPVWIVAGDKSGGRLIIFERDQTKWVVRDRIRLMGFGVGGVRAGSFGGDGEPGVLCLADDAFAMVRLGGRRPALEQFAAFRSESEDRQDFQMAAGDLNSDGYTDLAVLDSREQMCQILTFSAARKIYVATEFEVFESRMFTGGDRRELEPRELYAADATGDGKDDLVMVVHDRVMIYPQSAEK